MKTINVIRIGLIALLMVFSVGVHAQSSAPSSGFAAPFQSLSALAEMANKLPPGPASKNGSSSCGGLTASGVLESPCQSVPAIFEGAAVGTCPAGSFVDLAKWGCYSCPAGYNPDLLESTDGPNKCVQNTYTAKASTSMAGIFDRPPSKFTKATLKGTACPSGSFFDPINGGECYSCPAGYVRSAAHVNWADACVVLAKENLVKATTHSKATGFFATDCPKGQFWDGIDGKCHSCPSGYKRTANSVTSSKACSQYVSPKQAKATVKGKAQCKTGEFVDFLVNSKSGGNCYSCPDVNAKRSVFKVTGDQACETEQGKNYSPATLVTALTCPADQIFDFAGRDTPALVNRIKAQNNKAVPSKNGGTCWSCAAGYRRSVSAVWEKNACDSVGIGWVMPRYTQPGLFGLDGAEAVVREIILKDTDLIRTIVLEIMNRDKKMSDSQVLYEAWSEIRDTPYRSAPLLVIAYSRMLAAANGAPTASAADLRMLASFQQMVTVRKGFLADQAYQAYTEWDKADFKKNDAYRAVLIATTVATLGVAAPAAIGVDLVKNGFNPLPDFAAITLASTVQGWVQDETQGFVVSKVLLSDKMQGMLFKHTAAESKAARYALTEAGQAAATKFGETLSAYVMRKTIQDTGAKVTGKMVLAALKAAGPQIMVDAAIEAMTAWIDLHLTRMNAGNDLKAKVAEAYRPFSVKRLDTSAGRAEVEGEWAQMMGHPRMPVDKVGFRLIAQQRLDALPKP